MELETRLLITERQAVRIIARHVVLDDKWAGGGYVRFADSNVSLEDLSARLRGLAQPPRYPEDDFFVGV